MTDIVLDQSIGDSDVGNFMKQAYHPEVEDAINIRSVERQMYNVKKASVNGIAYNISELVGGNFRYEGRFLGDILPGNDPSTDFSDVAAPLKSLQLRVKRRYSYTVATYDGPMDHAPSDSSGGWEKLSAMVLKQTMKAVPEMESSKLARGQLAIKGEVASANTTSGVITLVAANAPATAATARPWAGNRFFREGDMCDLVTTNGGSPNPTGALRTGAGNRGLRVTAVSTDGTTPTITVASLSGSAIAAGDLLTVFKERVTSAIDSQSEWEDGLAGPMGIMDAIQNGSDTFYALAYYGNVAVSGQRVLQSHQITNTNTTALTPNMCNVLGNKMFEDPLGGGECDGYYTTQGVYREMAKPFTTMTNFSTNNPVRYNDPGAGFEPTVGVKGLMVNNIGSTGSKRFLISAFAPHYRAYAYSKSSMIEFVDKEFGPLNKDQSQVRWVNGVDAWQIIWAKYTSGIFNFRPNKSGLITGLLGDSNNA